MEGIDEYAPWYREVSFKNPDYSIPTLVSTKKIGGTVFVHYFKCGIRNHFENKSIFSD